MPKLIILLMTLSLFLAIGLTECLIMSFYYAIKLTKLLNKEINQKSDEISHNSDTE